MAARQAGGNPATPVQLAWPVNEFCQRERAPVLSIPFFPSLPLKAAGRGRQESVA